MLILDFRRGQHVLENPDVTLFVDGTGNAWNLDLAKNPRVRELFSL